MEEFLTISQQLGKNILAVQGAGGNTSVKKGAKMYIKASGEKLKNMKQDHGYVCLQYQPLTQFFSNKKKYTKQDEFAFLQLVDKSIIRSVSFGEPSMEAGFHAVIPSTYVIHLHSIYANIFTCMQYGSAYLKKIFHDIPFLIIDYKNPGYALASHLAQQQTVPSVIFLKNHGIIIHGNKIDTCVTLFTLLHQRIELFLKEHKVYFPFKTKAITKGMKQYLIPDSAVFANVTTKNLPSQKRNEITEIMSMQEYILTIIKKLNKQPVFLKKRDVNKLLAMKQEKYRQQLFHK